MNDKKKKKEEKAANTKEFGEIKTKAEMKDYLLGVRDKMTDEAAAPVYVASALNYAFNLPNVYELLNEENKEIARDLWLRIKQSGMQLKDPLLLFSAEETNTAANT